MQHPPWPRRLRDIANHPPPVSPGWKVSVWIDDGADQHARLLAEGVVDTPDSARRYAQQTAAGCTPPDGAHLWVSCMEGRYGGHPFGSAWSPLEDAQPMVAVFDETRTLGVWVQQ